MTLQVGIRVYASGNTKATKRTPEGIHGWLEYNRTARFGNALFVDGKLASPEDVGYLNAAQIAQVEKILAEISLDHLEEDTFGPQMEYISAGMSRTYMGYAPERYEPVRFRWENADEQQSA